MCVCALHDAVLQTVGVLSSNFMFNPNNINVAVGMCMKLTNAECTVENS